MDAWIPVLGTLAGAVVAGGISYVLHRSSTTHAHKTLLTNLAEERAMWAAEHELERIQKFYKTVEHLKDAATTFRIVKAWIVLDGEAPPDWLPSEKDARESLENAISQAQSETLLLDQSVQEDFERAFTHWDKWFLAGTEEDGFQSLLDFESDMSMFRQSLGERYRHVFDARRTGSDITHQP